MKIDQNLVTAHTDAYGLPSSKNSFLREYNWDLTGSKPKTLGFNLCAPIIFFRWHGYT